MNFYPHHIGDFNSATRHLTRVERSLYRDLIEVYYDTEIPLPADDFDRLCRKVMAHTEEEKKALEYVLGEFFILNDDVYSHIRCQLEIEKYRANTTSKSKAGKASAEARRIKREQMLDTRSTDEQRNSTNQEPVTNNQEPVTNNQEPRKEKQEDKDNTLSGKKPNIPYKRILDMMNCHLQTNFKNTQEFKKLVKARFCDGFTEEEFEVVVQKQLEAWNNDDKMRQYLRPTTLFGNKMNNYLGGNSSGNQRAISKREEINRGAIQGFMDGEVIF